MNPQFPIYIPSKGRADSRLTFRALQSLGISPRIVIEEQEWSEYSNQIPEKNLIILDKSYQRNYETCDSLGDTKSKGPGPARNFIWEHSISEGHPWHWVMDDNIRDFRRLNGHAKIKVSDGSIFRAMEDFCLRYENVAMAGPDYTMFAYTADPSKVPPFVLNTRIYSCNLIRNDVPLRWRGRYNEDTILSLDMLKAGWCTILFKAFLQGKIRTQTLKGGCTGEFYAKEGTLAKSLMQARVHPDVSRIVHKFGRIHHYVDYRPFRNNKLIRKKDIIIPEGINNYGMKLVMKDSIKQAVEHGKAN